MSQLLQALTRLRPGSVDDSESVVTIRHNTSDVSMLWKAHSVDVPPGLDGLGDLYRLYDGADLLSSTFKVASRYKSQAVGSVEITPTLEELRRWAADVHAEFPAGAVPFMNETGIWIYAYHPKRMRILKWDAEGSEMAQDYSDMEEVLQDWADAVA